MTIKKNEINYKNMYFLSSSSKTHNLPNDNVIEIAITGRSNVGKSSIINAISNQKKLARTSKKPGCTKTINIFEIKSKLRLIDFPGYGYAPIKKNTKYIWHTNLYYYIKNRKNLKGLIILIDIRHLIHKKDKQIIQLSTNNNIATLILLNKADKINKNLHKKKLEETEDTITKINKNIKTIIYSNINKKRINIIKNIIQKWINQI